ncbi:MAG: 4-hydroxy-tetrahydrodipicolinate synthase [Bdellovibrionota bacterium]
MELALNLTTHWHGLWTALVTPLTSEAGKLRIDAKSLARLIEKQLASKSLTGLVIAGSTGEGSLLSEDNFRILLQEAAAIVNKRVPLIAGVGIGGTESALKNASVIAAAGYQGLLASPPAYVKSPQRGLVKHFSQIASVGLPVCLYEVAGRAASSIHIETIAEIVTSPANKNIVAVKDASADIPRQMRSSELFGKRLALLSGDDFSFAPFLCSGGHGVISVATHVVPRRMKRIYDLVLAKKLDEAVAEQNLIRPLVDALFWESNPIPVKSLVKDLGLIEKDVFCAPLEAMDPLKRSALLALFKEIGDLP